MSALGAAEACWAHNLLDYANKHKYLTNKSASKINTSISLTSNK